MLKVAARQRAPLVVRLVASVVLAMAAISVLGDALIFWRVDASLDSQLAQDVQAYRDVGTRALAAGEGVPGGGRFRYQIFTPQGRQIAGSHEAPIAPIHVITHLATAGDVVGETGGFLAGEPSYVWVVTGARSHGTPVVALFAINRHDHNQALWSLLVQLTVGTLATMGVAGWLGYRTARAALAPVERYRAAAASADGQTRLPIGRRDDELSRLGRTFNGMLDRIEKSQERERRFLADASHELRAPLSLMKAEVEVALGRGSVSDDRRIETLKELGRHVSRLERLCNALLELEELGAARQPLTQVADVGAVLAEVAAHARALPASAGRLITVELDHPLSVRGNRHWLGVAVSNLVSNALRYGQGEVVIGARKVLGGAEIWVDDQGPGMPAAFVPRAFERFARVDESRSIGGTGLGLALVAEIAELHGATIAVDGARVTLRFPDPGAAGR